MKCKQSQKYIPKKNVKENSKLFRITIAKWLLSPGEVSLHGKLDFPNLNYLKNGQERKQRREVLLIKVLLINSQVALNYFNFLRTDFG